MPRTRSLVWSELKLGILTIAAIVIAATTIFLVTGGRGFFWQRYSLKTRFANVAGLKPGSPVRVAGLEVGSVESIGLAGDLVEVVFDVNRTVGNQITTTSTARLGSVSLLGTGAVDITASERGTPIPAWGYVPAGPAPTQISDITDTANQGLEQITGLVRDLRSGRGTAGRLITDDALYRELQQFVASAGDLTRSIREGKGTIGKLVTDPKTAQALEASLSNLEAMTARLNAGEGSLGKLLKDEAFATSLTATTANLRSLSDKANRGEGTIGKLMTDATLFNRLNSLTDRLDQLTTRLNDGQGTAGQLLKDKQLYENMNGAVSDIRSLVADIRKDPRKFLNVRVSLF
jgi:phospholipid/cholesterol/gamma-HCH transport system substrate-binding protein